MSTSIATEKIVCVLAQRNYLVGAIEENARGIIADAISARDEYGAAMIVYPELALTGYPPEDLLLRADLRQRVTDAVELIKQSVQGIVMVIGLPWHEGGMLYNSAMLLHDGAILGIYHKQSLPNYSVFDEKRYFSPGTQPCVVKLFGMDVGITVCEDIWQAGAVTQAAAAGAGLIINLNASPFHCEKQAERYAAIRQRIDESGVAVIYCNLVGGQDELVFDGSSFVMDSSKQLVFQAPAFSDALYPIEINALPQLSIPQQMCEPIMQLEESIYHALVLGVRDYVNKNGFKGVVIGLSGGIDSALTLKIAVDAIGADRVTAVMMPSRYTATMSVEDATQQAAKLGVEFHVIAIEAAHTAFLQMLEEVFAGLPEDTSEENIQARCRGVLLMAISNKFGKMVLTTGNKSEMSVGYATLYGDMAGGFDVLKDVSKTMVYRLSEYCNRDDEYIPRRVIDRPPSAELAPDQKDSDSLPDYDVLDEILRLYIEEDASFADIVARGFALETVRHVLRLVDLNEYKRRQAPPGVRITQRGFGRDRRYPITSGFGRNNR